MPFNAALIAKAWGPITWEPTPRRILALKAAIAPEDAAALDDLAPDGLTASPMHCVTPEWDLALKSRADPAQTLSPEEARRGVHIGQDSHFHSPVGADEPVAVTAIMLGARASRAGVISTTRYIGASLKDGRPLWHSHATSLLRGVALSGPDAGDVEKPDFTAELTGAHSLPIRLAAGLPHVYSECADIWNPIHTERAVARAAGLTDIIVHGTALWALAGQALINHYADGDQVALRRLACSFVGQALPGQTARLHHGLIGDAVAWRLDSATGEPLVAGRAEFGLPII